MEKCLRPLFDEQYRYHADSTPTGKWDEKQFNDGLQLFRQSYTYPNQGGGVQNRSNGCLGRKYLFPVVVHNIHLPSHSIAGMGSNINDAQIANAIEKLHMAFRNASLAPFPSENTGIHFVLARFDKVQNALTVHKISTETGQMMGLKMAD